MPFVRDILPDAERPAVRPLGQQDPEGDQYQYDFVPVPTDQCNLCAERTAKDKLPLCVQHCQGACMQYGPVDELVANFNGKTRFAIFVPNAGTVKE